VYKIAIPSYKRPEIFRDKTLALLQKYKIPKEKIYIFLADRQEREIYKKVIPDYCDRMFVAVPGMRNVRNFIQDWFPEGQHVVNIDDDIKTMKIRLNDSELGELENLDKLILDSFKLCEKMGCSLWGIHPVHNPLFMQNKITFGLKYIGGGVWGVINTHDKETYVTMDDKEDFERSIKFYIRDKMVMRVNYICMITDGYFGKGGMQETRTEVRVKASGMALLQKYPMFCEYNKARKKHFEIRLVDKIKKGR